MNKPANEKKLNTKGLWFALDNDSLKELVKGPRIFLTVAFVGIAIIATATIARLGLSYCLGWTILGYAIGYLMRPSTKDLEEVGAYLLLVTVTVSGLVFSLALLVSTVTGL